MGSNGCENARFYSNLVFFVLFFEYFIRLDKVLANVRMCASVHQHFTFIRDLAKSTTHCMDNETPFGTYFCVAIIKFSSLFVNAVANYENGNAFFFFGKWRNTISFSRCHFYFIFFLSNKVTPILQKNVWRCNRFRIRLLKKKDLYVCRMCI